MKHIKLFESFSMDDSSNPIITAEGNYSKLTLDGEPLEWSAPNTYTVTYYKNPPENIKELADSGMPGAPTVPSGYPGHISDPSDVAMEIMGGDQNGSTLTQYGNMIALPVDKSYSPDDYKAELEVFINDINRYTASEEDQCIAYLEDPSSDSELTPEFLAHCRAVCEKNKYVQSQLKHYTADIARRFSGYKKMMVPRTELIFKVV